MIRVSETNLDQIKEKLLGMRTNLNKEDYLESAFKKDLSIEIKKFILATLSELYELDKMYSKAAKAMSNKARFDTTFSDKISSYKKSAELFCKIGSIEDAEDMFSRAFRESNEVKKLEIIKFRKELYLISAEKLENLGKKSNALRFYEKLINMKLDVSEKERVKGKLVKIYSLLGRFKEAELISKL